MDLPFLFYELSTSESNLKIKLAFKEIPEHAFVSYDAILS